MHFINPFKGLRPIEDKASSVSIPSTDQLSQEVIVNHKKNNPWSYLNIFNPDSENSKSQNEINAQAKKQFELMKNQSVLTKDNINSFYVYKISTKNHSQIGIVLDYSKNTSLGIKDAPNPNASIKPDHNKASEKDSISTISPIILPRYFVAKA